MQLVSVSYKLNVVPGMEIGFFQDLNIQGDLGDAVSIQVNDAIKEAFDTAELGDIFHISIVASYNYSNSNIPYFQRYFPLIPFDYVPNPKIPNLLVTSPINKDTSISGFSLQEYITTDSPGALSYSILTGGYDDPNFAPGIAIDSNGYVTIYAEGTNTILVTQSASVDKVYATATASTLLIVSAPPPSGLIARYPFDSNGNDISTNNNNLTNNNTVTFNTINYKQGSGAASFNGSNYFQIANDGRFSPDNFTVAFWIKPVSSNGVHQAIASCRNMSGNVVTGWLIYIDPASNLTFITGGGGSEFYGTGNIYTNFGRTVTTWVHVAITMTKSTRAVVLYINGSLYTTSEVGAYSNNTGSNLRIGAGANEEAAQFFIKNGSLMDDFRIYDSALSASQISAVVADLS
jgi:hypothetical protein